MKDIRNPKRFDHYVTAIEQPIKEWNPKDCGYFNSKPIIGTSEMRIRQGGKYVLSEDYDDLLAEYFKLRTLFLKDQPTPPEDIQKMAKELRNARHAIRVIADVLSDRVDRHYYYKVNNALDNGDGA